MRSSAKRVSATASGLGNDIHRWKRPWIVKTTTTAKKQVALIHKKKEKVECKSSGPVGSLQQMNVLNINDESNSDFIMILTYDSLGTSDFCETAVADWSKWTHCSIFLAKNRLSFSSRRLARLSRLKWASGTASFVILFCPYFFYTGSTGLSSGREVQFGNGAEKYETRFESDVN